MFRSLFGFALFAVVAIFLLNVFGFIVFSLIGIAFLVLKFAIIGFIIYFIIKLFAPDTAARIREAFTGKPAA
jgi:uncharacterized membrane protein